ncbi:MAG: cysteine hydrolase [Actinomycetia bacterium]|nr:cysteine hydrolase [Actinomycetes bacterium]
MSVADWNGSTALIVVDVQKGFDDAVYWGPRNNPECEANVGRLIDAWRKQSWPIVFVRHDSATPSSPLAKGSPGNAFKSVVKGTPDLLVVKDVHSAFHGSPDLDAWLRKQGITGVAIAGIQTNMCCETTARVASDLGYELLFVEDATHTFDITTPTHKVYRAREIARYSSLSIEADFGKVVRTTDLVD